MNIENQRQPDKTTPTPVLASDLSYISKTLVVISAAASVAAGGEVLGDMEQSAQATIVMAGALAVGAAITAGIDHFRKRH